MPKKRTSSAKYTDEEKNKLLGKVPDLFEAGYSISSAAKKIGVHPQTLKRWLEEHGWNTDYCDKASKDCCGPTAEQVEEMVGCLEEGYVDENVEPVKLSRQEVRDLCEEYEELAKMKINADSLTATKIASASHNARYKRLDEIRNLLGMDAIDEYQEKKALLKRVDDLEKVVTAAHKRVDETKWFAFWLSLSVVAVAIQTILNKLS